MFALKIHRQDYSIFSLQSITDPCNIKEFTTPDKVIGLFHEDIVNFNEYTNKITYIKRLSLPVKIIGVLELYSKYSFKPNKRGVPAYIFTPLNTNYPKCIVHSTIRRKYSKNVLLTVDYTKWDKTSKFASGNINNIYGVINDTKAIQESILTKYNLPVYKLKYNLSDIDLSYKNLLDTPSDREFVHGDIISIDPVGCTDIDDALTITHKNGNIIFDIHIADVFYLLTQLNLINQVTNVTSIYLDTFIKHMLPTIISSNYGSLIAGSTRFMLSLKIDYNPKNNSIISSKLRKTYGKITKNYSYDNYPKRYYKYAKHIENIYEIVTGEKFNIYDSHKLIEGIMVIYNTEFCKVLHKEGKQPIYRIQKSSKINCSTDKKDSFDKVDDKLSNFMSLIQSKCAEYSFLQEMHSSLKIKTYTHATSPLRRIVDLINQEIFYSGVKTIEDRITIIHINDYNKKLKRAYRDINKIILAQKVYETSEYNTECYVYDVDINLNKLYLYFPKENISIKTSIVHNKIGHMYTLTLVNGTLFIRDINDNDMQFKLNILIDVKINGKPDIYNPDKSIIIQFKNIFLE